MALGPYVTFIAGSYGLVTAVVILLILWTVLDYRTQRKRLRDLERAGVTRRSTGSTGDTE